VVRHFRSFIEIVTEEGPAGAAQRPIRHCRSCYEFVPAGGAIPVRERRFADDHRILRIRTHQQCAMRSFRLDAGLPAPYAGV